MTTADPHGHGHGYGHGHGHGQGPGSEPPPVTDVAFVDAGGTRLCVRDQGPRDSPDPAVVLLHGTTANLGVWDAVVAELGPGVRTLAVDQRGHGRSERPPGAGYGAAEYVADVAALLRECVEGPAVIAGHSLGARNAVVLGARHPELVAGVVAVDYTPYVEPEVLDALDARVRGGDRAFASAAEVEGYLAARYPLLPAAAVARRLRYGYRQVADAWRPLADPRAMRLTVEGLRRDFDAETRAIRVPVTVLRGEHSRIVSRRAFDATVASRPDFRAVHLPGLDHYVPEEDPTSVAREIRRTLDAAAKPRTRS
ncbi:alpha/beta fold hydrolase [Streptomyces sp. 4N509B]|uniref:alpha/beta fold hydrolase n=1 Tax=Streptomyces sp. 4N509B TaxID=3457413 RepID=UPI003FD6897E